MRPRASRPPLYSLLCSLVNRLIAHASLRRRFMIERRFRHTSTRGSVAPRRTSDRRFIGDCIHPSLLRRGIRLRQRRQVARRAKRGALRSKVARGRATEPPDSHTLPSTRSTCSTRLNPSAHSASLRLCVKSLLADKVLSQLLTPLYPNRLYLTLPTPKANPRNFCRGLQSILP